MGYPLQMYKGSYTESEIKGEQLKVEDAKQEKAARNKGFVDGHEFFSRPPEVKAEK